MREREKRRGERGASRAPDFKTAQAMCEIIADAKQRV